MIRTSAINLVLKVGLAMTSFAFTIVSFFRPDEIVEYYPDFIVDIFGDLFVIAVGSAISFVLAIWIISGRHKFAVSFTYMILISIGMISNIGSLRFLSVSWPLFCISCALSLRYYPRVRVIISKKLGDKHIEKMKIVPAFDDSEYTEKDEDNEKSINIITPEKDLNISKEEKENIEYKNEAPNLHNEIVTEIHTNNIQSTDNHLYINTNRTTLQDTKINAIDSNYHTNLQPEKVERNIFGFKKKKPAIKVSKPAHKHSKERKGHKFEEEVQ